MQVMVMVVVVRRKQRKVKAVEYLTIFLRIHSCLEVREGLLPLFAEPFVFQFAIQKYKYSGVQNYNFVCCVVWVRNMVAHTEGGAQVEGV